MSAERAQEYEYMLELHYQQQELQDLSQRMEDQGLLRDMRDLVDMWQLFSPITQHEWLDEDL